VLAQAFGIVRPIVRQAVRLSHDAAGLRRLLTTDPLTGTLNRQGFHDRGAVEIAKAKRYNRPLSLLMIDPDQLEPITAAHGLGARETVLKALTETLFDGTRSTDLVGRVGGKAFAVLLPETDHAGAELLAERLRRRIGELTVPIKNAMVSSTVSIGVAAAEKNASFFAPIVARADEALYEAQMRGRNRVFVHAA
jgi:diguanylate cyclase (GGDEF)-like protein